MKKCDNCWNSFNGEGHTPVNENFVPQKGVVYCPKCYGDSLVKRTVILQQDDCAPDSLDTFEEAFKTKFGFTFQEFKKKAKRESSDDKYVMTYTLNGIEASIEAGSPWWVVSEIE